ncbi:TRAP transporter small permease subunit [Roseovarius aestuarii]|uniref:TRAP transporter small permease protein n=1 Tax=Roseovarius aestuarii TaxID=475083 RepID=A0A1X7BW33_9RHOB|nr:TRAP transporter small permease subunit [Roseovarius aestuarii]SMC13862.1 Tripartite ATP-independent periplasmic transporters, DctQ component [Roseovarius aestuarii]
MKQLLVNIARLIERIGRWLGEITSWLALGVLASVLVAVIASAMRANVMLDWGVDIPLFGDNLTVNDVIDLEWHFFAIMVMIGGTYAYMDDKHVRSDLIYAGLSQSKKKWIDTLGDVFLMMPFAAVMCWLSIGFVMRSYNSSEGSDYGGMLDRFLIKSTIPIGFAILFLVILARVIRRLLDDELADSTYSATEESL